MIEFLAARFWTSNDISIHMKSGNAITKSTAITKPRREASITYEHLKI